MVVGHTMILPNKRVSARESAQKRVLLALLLCFMPTCHFSFHFKFIKLQNICSKENPLPFPPKPSIETPPNILSLFASNATGCKE